MLAFQWILLIHDEGGSESAEAFSLRTVDPRWLIYLPGAIASIQDDRSEGQLEHPVSAFDYYRGEGVGRLVVETKHMGSRGILVLCRDPKAAESRFGRCETGCIYTRNGRPFFSDAADFLTEV